MFNDITLNVKIEYIKVFVMVAKYNNITKVAKSLHYTQPMISKIISTLELELGIILFLRTKNGLVLTPAGKLLYERWDNLFMDVAIDIFDAQLVQQNKRNSLKIGFIDLINQNKKITSLLNRFLNLNSDLFLDVELFSYNALLEHLNNRYLDLIFISQQDYIYDPDDELSWTALSNNCLTIYYNKNNPLEYKKNLQISDLSSQNFIVLSPSTYCNYLEFLTELTKENGFIPRISCYTSTISAIQINIELGNGIALLSGDYDITSPNVCACPLQEFPCKLIAVWRKDNEKKVLQQLLDMLIQSII